MKSNFKSIILSIMMLLIAVSVSAQTADEVIAKYLQAIGGKELLGKINSVYTENKLSVMGNEVIQKTTLLAGKGYKQEMDMMGSTMITCITDKGGWTINPMTGNSSPVDMPEAQYNPSKDEIHIGGIYAVYSEKGYKAELAGNEAVGNINAVKIKMTAPDNTSSSHFFDPATGYLVRMVQQGDMQGQQVENVYTFSDYKQVEGYSVPYSINISIGGMFEITAVVSKVELNIPVDPAIFAKP
jgi:hypothetical protein